VTKLLRTGEMWREMLKSRTNGHSFASNVGSLGVFSPIDGDTGWGFFRGKISAEVVVNIVRVDWAGNSSHLAVGASGRARWGGYVL